MQQERGARLALKCLFIAVEEAVAKDVQAKCLDAFDELNTEIDRLRKELQKVCVHANAWEDVSDGLAKCKKCGVVQDDWGSNVG